MAAGSSVSVIDREQIEARQASSRWISEGRPGLCRQSLGQYRRPDANPRPGAEANQVLVLIDGIEANDPAGNDEFAFQDLTTWDVERIEVVRGPQSALWGSDALAGVVNVITRQPTEEFSAGGFAEGGAYATYSAGGRVSGEVLGARAGSPVTVDQRHQHFRTHEDDGHEKHHAT
jgi:vitamin B12 transporter